MSSPDRFRTSWRSWLVLALFLLTLPAVTTRFYASDEVEFFAWLHSVAFDRDADFQNEYQHFYDSGAVHNDGFRSTFLDDVNEAGRRPNFAPMGSAMLWAPFYAIGHAWAVVTGAPADGYSQPYITAVTYGSAIYGCLALMLSAAIARRLVGGHGALAAACIALGTPLLFYMYVAPGFSHACSAFAVALFIWLWLRVRERWSLSGVALLGVVGALLPMVREQDAFFLVGPALDFCRWAWLTTTHSPETARGPRVTAAGIAARIGTAAVTLVVAYIPQLVAYHALNGHFSPTSKVARKMTWTSPHAVEVLVSLQHGFLLWTPLALLGIAGLVVLARSRRADSQARDARWIALLALAMVALQVYVSGSVESWTVAGSFGQRRFVAITPLLVLGLAGLLNRSRSIRRVTVCAALVAIWWNLGLMAQFGLHTMDRQRLSVAANARATFVDLPRIAPSLVWRYLTDRASFYGRSRQ